MIGCDHYLGEIMVTRPLESLLAVLLAILLVTAKFLLAVLLVDQAAAAACVLTHLGAPGVRGRPAQCSQI